MDFVWNPSQRDGGGAFGHKPDDRMLEQILIGMTLVETPLLQPADVNGKVVQ
ncbi:hypothetical protein D3C73_1613680 [compost metagenome]